MIRVLEVMIENIEEMLSLRKPRNSHNNGR
jgi:hypothetical protein